MSTITVSLSDACRLCLEVHTDNVKIFGNDGQKRSLAQKVWKHLSIWVTEEDSFPKKICQHCIKEVEHFSSFYTKVECVQNVIHVGIPQTSKGPAEEPESNDAESNDRDILLCNIKVESIPFVDGDVKESSREIDSADNDFKEDIKPEVSLQSPPDTVHSITADSDANTAESEGLVMSYMHNQHWNGNTDQCGRLSYGGSPDLEMEEQCENYSGTNSDTGEDDAEHLVFQEENNKQDVNLKSNSKPEDQIKYDLASFYKLSCEFCQNNEIFEKYELLERHCLDEHNSRAFVICCSRRLSGKDLLRKHMRKHIKPFKCQLCCKELSTQWTLNCHMLTMHAPVEKLPFRCKKCPKGFATKNALKNHESDHLWKEEMSGCICDLCGKKYSNPRCLYAHKFYQHRKQSVMCHMCPRFFSTPAALRQHLRSHHGGNDNEPEQCKRCGKTLKNKVTMRTHMKLHEEDVEAFPCEQCDKIFKSMRNLRAHQLAHSSERPHKCHICNKSFKKKYVLKEHMTQHTGERPHQCPHCPRTFACKANYYTHKRKMHGSPDEAKPDINPNLYQ